MEAREVALRRGWHLDVSGSAYRRRSNGVYARREGGKALAWNKEIMEWPCTVGRGARRLRRRALCKLAGRVLPRSALVHHMQDAGLSRVESFEFMSSYFAHTDTQTHTSEQATVS